MQKTVRMILVFILATILSACNLPSGNDSAPVPNFQATATSVPLPFAQVYIAKPGTNFQKWADLNITAGQTDQGSTEFTVNMVISDPSKSNLIVTYGLMCNRQNSVQTGYFLSGLIKISCLGNEFQLYVNNILVMEEDGTQSVVIGSDFLP